MPDPLTPDEQDILLRLAREALERGVRGVEASPLDLSGLPPVLRASGSSFVTLTSSGELRGCIGSLEARIPLAEDVRAHAVAAALRDARFPPVQEGELPAIQIEISRLTEPVLLPYHDAQDLLSKLRPHVDGLILQDALHGRATFLPQVWQKIPDPAQFLDNLCQKLSGEAGLWRRKHLDVLTYRVEEFHE